MSPDLRGETNPTPGRVATGDHGEAHAEHHWKGFGRRSAPAPSRSAAKNEPDGRAKNEPDARPGKVVNPCRRTLSRRRNKADPSPHCRRDPLPPLDC
jgi:hypothetical protein